MSLSKKRKCRSSFHNYSYTEAISILYSHNTFEFRDLLSFLCFPTTILPARINVIRNLQLTCRISNGYGYIQHEDIKLSPYSDSTWKNVCEIMKNMSSLQDLQVDLMMGEQADLRMRGRPLAHPLDGKQELQLFLPLMGIRQARKFVAIITWPMQWNRYDARGWWDKPFELVETHLKDYRISPSTNL